MIVLGCHCLVIDCRQPVSLALGLGRALLFSGVCCVGCVVRCHSPGVRVVIVVGVGYRLPPEQKNLCSKQPRAAHQLSGSKLVSTRLNGRKTAPDSRWKTGVNPAPVGSTFSITISLLRTSVNPRARGVNPSPRKTAYTKVSCALLRWH